LACRTEQEENITEGKDAGGQNEEVNMRFKLRGTKGGRSLCYLNILNMHDANKDNVDISYNLSRPEQKDVLEKVISGVPHYVFCLIFKMYSAISTCTST
jgi:hypothetical protein